MSVAECELEEGEWCEAHGNALPCWECRFDSADLYMDMKSDYHEGMKS